MWFQVERVPSLKCVLMSEGLFAVEGYPDYYFWAGRFYRKHDGMLQSTSHWNGKWVSEIPTRVPPRGWTPFASL